MNQYSHSNVQNNSYLSPHDKFGINKKEILLKNDFKNFINTGDFITNNNLNIHSLQHYFLSILLLQPVIVIITIIMHLIFVPSTFTKCFITLVVLTQRGYQSIIPKEITTFIFPG